MNKSAPGQYPFFAIMQHSSPKKEDYHPGGRGHSTNFYAGRLRPRFHRPYPLIYHFWHDYHKFSLWYPRLVSPFQGFIRMADLIQLTFKILMKFTYGRDMTADELQELLDLRALVESLIGDTFSNPFVKFPLYKYMPTSTNRKLAQFEKRWLQFNKR